MKNERADKLFIGLFLVCVYTELTQPDILTTLEMFTPLLFLILIYVLNFIYVATSLDVKLTLYVQNVILKYRANKIKKQILKERKKQENAARTT